MNRGRVLVVDDDDTVRLLAAAALGDAGYGVMTARNAAEALAVLATDSVDCLVTDVQMPGMDGFELCARVRNLPGLERVQVLVMTGSGDHAAIENAYKAGASDFIVKHSHPAMLVERVRFIFRSQQLQDELRISEQRLLYAQRLAVLGHWERTLDGRTLAMSSVVSALLNLDDPLSMTWQQLCDKSHADDVASMQSTLQRAVEHRSTFRLEHRVLLDAQRSRVLLHHGEVIDNHGVWMIRSTVQDVTDVRAQEERIQYMALHDPLTALPNRESASRTLGDIIASAAGNYTHVAVFALWLDDFHRVASSLGQRVSDALLKQVGTRLRRTLRGSDRVLQSPVDSSTINTVVARADGDKFLCVVCHLQQSEHALTIAKRLQQAIAEPLQMGDTELALTGSVGISVFPEDGQTPEALIDNAIAALLDTAGQKNTCQFFANEISDRARQRLSLESELRHAVDNNEFELHFQPRMCLKSGNILGAEALVRWRHAERGMISPIEFIPLAEATGLIVPLGNHVIDMAARQATHWRQQYGPTFRISFNISPLQFSGVDLVAQIDRAVQREHAWHVNLEAEITESALMSRQEQVVKVLHDLRERGLRLALDDFGTGFSSLSYLRELPLDVLKVDRSFVSNIGQSRSGSSLVNAILYVAHALNLTCVAEGVENSAQRDFLAANGCQEMQGFLLAKPMSVADFELWMPEHQSKRLSA
jgi:diguanylate cyclase (GGDEF)-like protein